MSVKITTKKPENPFHRSLTVVWEHPTCVFVNEKAIATMANTLASDLFPIPSWRDAVFPQSDNDVFTDFIGVGNAINFAFTDFATRRSFHVEYRGKEWRGAFAMWACLSSALERGVNILDGRFLQELDMKGFSQIFVRASGLPMLEERLQILRDIGTGLTERYGGAFHNLFAEAQYKAFGRGGIIERLLTDFPSFRDESIHRPSGTVLTFHKRAQLLAMMYAGRALDSTRLPCLSDFHLLGPIADYSVPKILHAAGVLQYSSELERDISEWSLIDRGSAAEQQIRAQTVQAQLLLSEQINALRSNPINSLALDYKLWSLGRALREPHHLTRTTAY